MAQPNVEKLCSIDDKEILLTIKYVYNVVCVNGTYGWVCVLADINIVCDCDVIIINKLVL